MVGAIMAVEDSVEVLAVVDLVVVLAVVVALVVAEEAVVGNLFSKVFK